MYKRQLQRDANRIFGFTAKQTLDYTQSLYEKRLCTYPRTDSQFLSDDMGQTAEDVIGAVFKSVLKMPQDYSPDIGRVLNSKKVTDHHAIIPTMEIAKQDMDALAEGEKKILSLISYRVLCATSGRHIYKLSLIHICSEEIEGILGNSDFVYLLNQNAKDQVILADKLGLSEKQLQYVTNSESGCGLILFNDVVIPFADRYPTDTKTYACLLYTSRCV